MSSSSSNDSTPSWALTNTNYVEWEFRMKAYLKAKALLKHLTPTVAPEKPHDPEKDTIAMGEIERRLDPSQFYHVSGLTTAAAIWEKLRSVHARTGMHVQLPIIIRLVNHRFIEGSPVEPHISTMRQDFAALRAAGLPMADEMQGGLLLSTMATPSWQITVSSITAASSANNATITFESVAAQFIQEDKHRASQAHQQGALETASAHLAASTGRPPRGGSASSGRPNCTVPGCRNPTTHSSSRCFITNGFPPSHSLHNAADYAKKKAVRDRNLGAPHAKPTASVAVGPPLTDDWGEACLVLPSEEDIAALASTASPDTLTFKVDSGASQHYVCQGDWFTSYTAKPSTVTVATGAPVQVVGRGTIRCYFESEQGRLVPVTLTDVNYVPDFSFNLLSSKAMHRTAGIECTTGQHCTIRNRTGAVIGVANGDSGLYRLTAHRPTTAAPTATTSTIALAAATRNVSADLWHQRMGHAHHKAVSKLFSATMVADTDAADIARTMQVGDTPTCEACLQGKQARAPIPTSTTTRATRPLERVHMDIWGPAPCESLGGQLYYLVIVDDYSRWMTLYSMRYKSDALLLFQAFTARVETFHSAAGHRITHVRTDNGGEFTSTLMKAFMTQKGMTPELTATYTPQQNGVAERANRTIMDLTRTLLSDSQLPNTFWADAAKTAVYARNRVPTSSLGLTRTPYEAWTGQKPMVSHMRRFGCLAWEATTTRGRNKLDPRSHPCTFIGYSETSNQYRLWDNAGRRVLEARSVTWDEATSGYTFVPAMWRKGGQSKTLSPPGGHPTIDSASDTDDSSDDDNDGHLPAAPPAHQPAPPAHQPSSKLSRAMKKLGNHMSPGVRDGAPSPFGNNPQAAEQAAGIALGVEAADEPRTYAEALKRPDAPKWTHAMNAELAALAKANTYSLVPRPTDRKVIGCGTVLKVKRGADGQVIKYKARIVAKGYAQTYGVDYEETYAPVVRYSSLRLVLSLTAHYDLELHQMDVKSAYLNGDLEEDIYMEQPEGTPAVKSKEDWVCKLHKSLYGLKQAGRTWHTKIDEVFQRLDLLPLASDPCVYIRRTSASLLIIALYVDDLVLAASALSELQTLKSDLIAEFDMEDIGEASFVLGIEIVRDRARRTLTITQTAYTKALVERHIVGSRHRQYIPMESSARHVKATDREQATPQVIRAYQSAVGSIMFAMLCTRPDIAFSVAVLSKFAQNPTALHVAGVQRVLHYLNGTTARGITYTGTAAASEEPQLTGFCDSDWAADRDDRKSITGYAFLLCGGAISWSSKKQKTPALSTVEAEYLAATAAAKEALWWRSQLRGLGYDTSRATTLYSDSQGSISLSKNPDHHANTKHIALRYHFIRHHVAKRNVHMQHVGTKAMAADVLTKALPRAQHEATSAMLGMIAA
jgi:hypothetical protein